jgi:hypothetical protein
MALHIIFILIILLARVHKPHSANCAGMLCLWFTQAAEEEIGRSHCPNPSDFEAGISSFSVYTRAVNSVFFNVFLQHRCFPIDMLLNGDASCTPSWPQMWFCFVTTPSFSFLVL